MEKNPRRYRYILGPDGKKHKTPIEEITREKEFLDVIESQKKLVSSVRSQMKSVKESIRKKNSPLLEETTVQTEKKRFVADMILGLKSRNEIQIALNEKYGVSPGVADQIMHKARLWIAKNYPVDRENIVVTHINIYYDIVKANKDTDPKQALKALEQVERLLRLHQEVSLIQHNTTNINFEKVSTDQLMKAIEKINQGSNNIQDIQIIEDNEEDDTIEDNESE